MHSEAHQLESDDGGGRQVDRGHQVRLVGVAVAVILLAWFAVANLRDVRIDFWVFDRQAPLILVIVISGLLGALITALVMRRKPKCRGLGPTRPRGAAAGRTGGVARTPWAGPVAAAAVGDRVPNAANGF